MKKKKYDLKPERVNDTGRPMKFKSAKDILDKSEMYFKKCIEESKPITITGLALALDTTREGLCEYESGKYNTKDNKFSDAIKRVKAIVEETVEGRLFGNTPTGAIFWLKNHGWKDKTETDLNVNGELAEKIVKARNRSNGKSK